MRPVTICLAVLASAVFSGCLFRTHVRVTPDALAPEEISRPALHDAAAQSGQLKVMLRVPQVEGNPTEQDAVRNTAYNTIEKEFLKAGYVVRDRALLLRVLNQNAAVDYKTIADKIDTDLILEIISMIPNEYKTRDYIRVKDERPGRAPTGTFFRFAGWRIEAKLVVVRSGEIGGIYSYTLMPTADYFILTTGDITQVRTASPEGLEEDYTFYSVTLDRAAALFAQGVIRQIRP